MKHKTSILILALLVTGLAGCADDTATQGEDLPNARITLTDGETTLHEWMAGGPAVVQVMSFSIDELSKQTDEQMEYLNETRANTPKLTERGIPWIIMIHCWNCHEVPESEVTTSMETLRENANLTVPMGLHAYEWKETKVGEKELIRGGDVVYYVGSDRIIDETDRLRFSAWDFHIDMYLEKLEEE